MILHKLKDMIGGWFVGDFDPSVLKTNVVEVGVKEYTAGEIENTHYHKIATEITVIIEGEVEMNGIRYSAGDILIIDPNESTDFKALTKVVNVVVKFPGATNDKYKVI